MQQRSQFNLIGLLVVIAIALLVVAFVAVTSDRSGESANRIRCGNNLRALSMALRLYADENRGQLPRTEFDPSQPNPVWGTPYKYDSSLGAVDGADPFAAESRPVAKFRPKANDVTAALFLFLRTQDVTTEVFICPATNQFRFEMGSEYTAQNWTNWPGNAAIRRHLSYSYDNPYSQFKQPSDKHTFVNIVAAEVPWLADMNPGGDAPRKVRIGDSSKLMRTANSRNHRGDGQNVAYADGHVEFQQNPFAGAQRDNIYTCNGPEGFGRIGEAAIVGPPADGNDAVMLPSAAELEVD